MDPRLLALYGHSTKRPAVGQGRMGFRNTQGAIVEIDVPPRTTRVIDPKELFK